MTANFTEYLNKFSEQEWLAAVEKLLPEIHEVDRNAVQIWFRFYPLSLFRYLEAAEDREQEIKKLAIQGDFELKNRRTNSFSDIVFGRKQRRRLSPAPNRKTTKSAI
jgi:hypothetical protein